MWKSIFVLILLMWTISVQGQKPVDLMLKQVQATGNEQCFDILLRSPSGMAIDLAGQNYRLFYNTAKLTFLPERINHKLDNKTYSKIDMIHTSDHDIGFISLSIDGKELNEKVLHLDKAGNWTKSVNLCFERERNGKYDITWANAKKTSGFATAEIALSEWVGKYEQQVIIPNEIYDISSEIESSTELIALSVYPNPTAEDITIDLSEIPQRSVQIAVKDVIGREILNEAMEGGQQLEYSARAWPAGTYSISVRDKTGQLLALEQIVKILN